MVAHKELDLNKTPSHGAYKIIQPDLIPVISYPYEWSFSQLKDAALATLAMQKLALDHSMVLRDASAYNIQFANGRPIMIDTLSFDPYKKGEAWIAYRQFCQHFLAPLVLMSRIDPDLSQLLRVYIDGIPLPLVAKLLPMRSRLNFGLATHITLHAKFQKKHEGTAKKVDASISRASLDGLLDNLERTVRGLSLAQVKTEWGDYYENTNYTDSSFKEKARICEGFLKLVDPKTVLDLGSNDGSFSRIASKLGAYVISADIDPLAVESNYLRVKSSKETNLLPLLINLTNPSPDQGWAGQERSSFTSRAGVDMALALALIHHLAIGNNVPLEMVSEYFAQLAPTLVIEFVPKEDSQVKRLLATREDVFPDYTVEGFEAAFTNDYDIELKQGVKGTARLMYLMRRKSRA